MRVGITLTFTNPPQWRRPWTEVWDEQIGWLIEAEGDGLDCAWIPEHFFTDNGFGPSMPMILTLLIERTERMRIGSDIYILPQHHAAQLAQETAALDHLSGGRLAVGVGLGHRLAEYRAFGVDRRDRRSLMEEGLDVLRLAWTTRPFSYSGKHYHLDNIEVYPEPVQLPHPPLWVAATTPPAAARAGRHGAHLQAASIDPAVYEAFRQGLAQGGHDPRPIRVANSFSFLATRQDPRRVLARNQTALSYARQFYADIRAELGDPPLHVHERGASVPCGDPDTILEMLQPYVKRFGLTDMIFVGPVSGVDPADARESLRLFGEEIMPVLKTW